MFKDCFLLNLVIHIQGRIFWNNNNKISTAWEFKKLKKTESLNQIYHIEIKHGGKKPIQDLNCKIMFKIFSHELCWVSLKKAQPLTLKMHVSTLYCALCEQKETGTGSRGSWTCS